MVFFHSYLFDSFNSLDSQNSDFLNFIERIGTFNSSFIEGYLNNEHILRSFKFLSTRIAVESRQKYTHDTISVYKFKKFSTNAYSSFEKRTRRRLINPLTHPPPPSKSRPVSCAIITPTRRRKGVEIDQCSVCKLCNTIVRTIIIVQHPRTICPVNRRRVIDIDERPLQRPPCILRSTTRHI